MTWRSIAAAGAGAALLLWLITKAGLTEVFGAALKLGLPGYVTLLGFQALLVLIMAIAWASLGRERSTGERPAKGPLLPLSSFIWGRLTRDGVSQALPMTQVGGLVVGGRALTLEGMSGATATASTITDLAIEFLTQLPFVGLGAVLLLRLKPGSPLGAPVLAVVAALGLMALGMVLAQYWGAHGIERAVRRIAARGASHSAAAPVAVALRDIARQPHRLVFGALLHLAAWILAAGQTWITLRWLHAPVSLEGAIVIDSLAAGLKAVAFFVPASLGVQEGGLVMLGLVFGVPPSAALALSLVRRARDLGLGLPALLAWQWRHGDRIWTARGEPDPGSQLV